MLLGRKDETASYVPLDPHKLLPERILAKGTFGTVASAKDMESGKRYAVKKIFRGAVSAAAAACPILPYPRAAHMQQQHLLSSNHPSHTITPHRSQVSERMQQQQLLDERAALSTFASPFLAELFGTHKTAVALFLVLELCDGPELYAVLKEQGKFGKDVVPLYAACVACALAELHSRKWMYRDLKAENVVFVSSGAVKLVDMGLAIRTPDGTEHFTQCGSTEYMAPEVVE